MKRSTLIIIALLLAALPCGNAFAAASSGGGKTEIDGMLSIATDPVSGFGATLGIGAGVGFDLSGALKPGSGRLFGRADINYFNWDETVFGASLSYTRVPIFVGGRYYVPMSGSQVDIFIEGGLEFSFDKVDTVIPAFPPFFFLKASSSDLNIGITPGFGIEVPISNDGLFVGGDARWHIINDDYFTLSLVLGKKF